MSLLKYKSNLNKLTHLKPKTILKLNTIIENFTEIKEIECIHHLRNL